MNYQAKQTQYIKITVEEMRKKDLNDFYDLVMLKLGLDPTDPDIELDCTCINISEDVQEFIINGYRDKYPGLVYKPDFNTQVIMALACRGPKVSKQLSNGTIEILDGFIQSTKV